jgi:FkbM family methyltransferase
MPDNWSLPPGHGILQRYCHWELPGWRRMLLRVIERDGWVGNITMPIRPHGYAMELDVTQPWERWSYLAGQYYETHTQMLMLNLLHEGDALLDVGANIGHVTLTGAWKVGPRGCVVAFEPNPLVFTRVRRHIAMNALERFVTVHNLALGDKAGCFTLSVPVEGTGGGTLGSVGSEYSGRLANQYTVRVAIGDALCAGVRTPLVIKIDVEGFEAAVIKGLRATIARLLPALLVEAWPEHLQNAGSSIDELFALAQDLGYHVYAVRTPLRVRGVTQSARLTLHRLAHPGPEVTDDVLWLHPDGLHRDRVASFIER